LREVKNQVRRSLILLDSIGLMARSKFLLERQKKGREERGS
jgi:hypothetical protein